MKLDEKTAIPVPREGRASDIKERDNSNIGRSYEGHHGFAPSHYSTYDRERSPPRPEKGQLDRPSRYTHITSQSAPVLATQSENAHSSRQNPISLEKMPLNEREKKWWDELRETAGKLADFASFVHRTGRIPPRNDLDWARSIFQIFAENMSALQMVSGVLQGEGPRFPDAGLSSLKMSNPSRYGKRLMSQSPTLESGNCKMLSTAFPPPPLNRHVSYDKVIDPDRSMRPSASLTAMTGERSDAPYNRQPPSIYDHRFSNRFEIGPERMDPEHNRWRERSSEPKRTREIGRPDNLPELNRPRDRASSSNGRTYAPSNEQDYSSEIAGPSRSGGNVPPSLTSPLGNFPRHPNDSPRSTYSARETDGFNQRAPLPGQHHSGKPAGLPVPQPPSRPSHAGRRASSDYGGTHYPTSYSPPYNMKSDERYGFRPPTDHYSAQQSAQMSNGYYRDEYRDANQHDQSYVSGDESGSMGFRPSKYRKRSRAPAPGSCVSCGARDTPEWRRGPNGARTLCNACGLHFSKLLRKKKQEEGNESAIVTVEELRSSLKIPGNGSAGQTSPF